VPTDTGVATDTGVPTGSDIVTACAEGAGEGNGSVPPIAETGSDTGMLTLLAVGLLVVGVALSLAAGRRRASRSH
jgi:LPXTG-motif cell wall-anchored protein